MSKETVGPQLASAGTVSTEMGRSKSSAPFAVFAAAMSEPLELAMEQLDVEMT